MISLHELTQTARFSLIDVMIKMFSPADQKFWLSHQLKDESKLNLRFINLMKFGLISKIF